MTKEARPQLDYPWNYHTHSNSHIQTCICVLTRRENSMTLANIIYSGKLLLTSVSFASILHSISIMPFVARKALSAWFGFRFPVENEDPKLLIHTHTHTFITMPPLLAILGLRGQGRLLKCRQLFTTIREWLIERIKGGGVAPYAQDTEDMPSIYTRKKIN